MQMYVSFDCFGGIYVYGFYELVWFVGVDWQD